jgi:hypothetical protein
MTYAESFYLNLKLIRAQSSRAALINQRVQGAEEVWKGKNFAPFKVQQGL